MAKGITESTVEEIKSRIDLTELISSYGISIKTAGSSKKACCPFHHEKTPSFVINEAKGFYHCFGCGESGDAIKFVEKMEGLTFVEAVRKLAGQCGVKIEEKEDPEAGKRRRLYALMIELAEFYHRCLKSTKAAAIAREYLAKRALGEKIQEDFLIGYAPSGVATILKWAEKYGYTAEELEAAGVIKGPSRPGDAGYHRFGGRLMFSIRDKQGRVVAFSGRQLVASKNSGKYVNSPETAIFKKSNVLFGFDRAAGQIAKSPHHEAIVCEGQIDTIRLHASGFPVAVASQGTAFTEEHVKLLKRVADQVVLVFDDDAAGHKATVRTAGLFLAAEMPVRTISLPDGDDPDSYLRKHPKEDFERLLDAAESIIAFQYRVCRAEEAKPDSIDAIQRTTRKLLTTINAAASAVMRATMVAEAAKLLGIPRSALEEELGKFKATPTSPRRAEREVVDDDEIEVIDEVEETPSEWKEAAQVVLPSNRETAFCEFLMANEQGPDAKTLAAMMGEFLPTNILAHELTRTFVEAWQKGISSGEDKVIAWSETLSDEGRVWFDELIVNQRRVMKSGEDAAATLEEFIRGLWCDRLVRLRGELPANDLKPETVEKRFRWTELIKQIPRLKWSAVKDIIRELTEGERQ